MRIDANGYYVGSPFSDQMIAARVHGGTTDALTVPGVTLPAGAVATWEERFARRRSEPVSAPAASVP